MSLPSSMADFVPCDRLLQKAYGTGEDNETWPDLGVFIQWATMGQSYNGYNILHRYKIEALIKTADSCQLN